MSKGFWIAGKLVNGAGKPINDDGTVIVEQQGGELTLEQAKTRIAELEAQLAAQADAGNPDSTDTRTNAELKAALDAKSVAYDARLNKAALQALAAEHGV